MAKFAKLIDGYVTDISPERVHIIGTKRYDFRTITAAQCEALVQQGCPHVKAAKKKPKSAKEPNV